MTSLPVDAVRLQVERAFAAGQPVLVDAPPGSGKTTRVPWWEAERRSSQVWLLEPRRLAARMAAERLAQQSGERVGDRVGYHIRHERRGGRRTQVWVMTEGVFLRRLQEDPLLEGVGTVLLDEFHERSARLDLALAFVREVQQTVRPDLALGILSATLDVEPLKAYLPDCVHVRAEGRLHPVDVEHVEGGPGHLPEQMSRVVRAVQGRVDGDILAFLPGAPEIRRTLERFRERPVSGVEVLPLYGGLPFEAQQRAVRPAPNGGRRVILATNVAESSLTIEGVRAVVDSGWVKRIEYDPVRGVDHLQLRRIAQDSADQRAGRAGRLGPGHAFRVWSEKERLQAASVPEIHRVDLAPVISDLLRWSERDPADFDWFDAPQPERRESALALLRDLGLVEPHTHRLTERGRIATALPLHPRWATFVLRARELGAGGRAVQVAALAQGRDVVRDPARFGRRVDGADLLARHRAVFGRSGSPDPELDRGAAEEARKVARQLERELDVGGGIGEDAGIQRALLRAFPDRVGRRDASGRVALAAGGWAELSSDSVVKAPTWLVAVEVEGGPRGLRIRSASEVEAAWLDDLAVKRERTVRFDPSDERVEAVEEVRLGSLVLERKPIPWSGSLDPAAALAQAAARNLDRALPWTDALDRVLRRIRFVRDAVPNADVPDLPDDVRPDLLDEVVLGTTRFSELRKVDLVEVLHRRHPGLRAQLDRDAPEAIPIPSGRKARLRYEAEGPPVLSAQLQELFGLAQTPRVARGRIPVKLEILAPNRRPVQITQDLESFWSRTYHEVRKDLRSRYPKHDWPEDPSQGVPRRRPKRS